MRRRFALVIGTTVLLTLGLLAGSAYAYFRSSGAGFGSGSTGALAAVTVVATTSTANTPLLPGGGPGDVILHVDNPNAFAVTLVRVTGNGTITADAGHPSCTTTGVTFTDQTNLQVGIPASNASFQVDLAAAASMNLASSNGCQGATFSIPVKITVRTP
jgi:hypothetical protein